jgi:spermidine synthase
VYRQKQIPQYMKLAQKIISYIFPSTRKIASDFNGDLEITFSNGRKVLDSAQANYSYGSLQRILKFALEQISFSQIERVLLLGLGGGSVVETLRLDFAFQGQIMAVEVDPVVIQIAEVEFGIRSSAGLQIICADALEFVRKTSETYDLIIVDLFIDNQIPTPFLTDDFWLNISQITCSNGYVIFNSMSKSGDAGLVKHNLQQRGFVVQEFVKVERTNTLLVATAP